MNHPVNPKNSPAPTTVYESAIDRWVVALLLLSPLTSTALGIYCFADADSDGAAILFAAAAGTLLISIALTLPCRYTLTQDAVSIRCGLFIFYQVLYTDIETIHRSSTWRSGPALSLNRVEIKTEKKSVIVSPKDRERFVEDLNERIAAV